MSTNQPPYGPSGPEYGPPQYGPPQYGPPSQPPQQPPQQPPPPQPPDPFQPVKPPKGTLVRWYNGRLMFAGIAAFLALMFGVAAGESGSGSTAANDGPVSGPTVTATATATATATQTVTAKARPAPTVTATETVKAKPRPRKTVTVTAAPAGGGGGGGGGEVTDGTYLVGTEIAVGNYKSSGGTDFCYADTETKSGDILDQEVSSGESVVVRITSAAYTFESDGCGSWTKVG